jgi:protein-disulfide isomerase
MLKNRGLTIGIAALVMIGALGLFLLKNSADVAQAADPTTLTSTAAKTGNETSTPADEAKKAADTDVLAAPAAMKIDVEAAMKEQVLGKEDAPVTIYEYASLTCPHCAYFATTILPEVKKKLIDTGKAKLIYRDFPLDKFAMKAAMMAHCVSPLKYYNMLEVLFSNQERWTKASDPMAVLSQLGTMAGMDADTFKSCTENKDLETAILTRQQEAQNKYKVESTPTFVFNDGAEKIQGALPVEKYEEIVNKLSQGK